MMKTIGTKVTLGFLLFFGSVLSLKENDKNHICPDYEVMKDFQISKFLGLWRVIQNSDFIQGDETRGDFSTPGPCYGFFYCLNNGEYLMNQVNSPIPPGVFSRFNNGVNNVGIYMSFTNAETSTNGILNFNGSIIEKGDLVQEILGEHVVLRTDYDNYAFVMTCITSKNDEVPLVTAAILYRKNEPNWSQIENLRSELLQLYTMISAKDLSNVSHIKCELSYASPTRPNFSTWTEDRRKIEMQSSGGSAGMLLALFDRLF